jgi:hypothetical protein
MTAIITDYQTRRLVDEQVGENGELQIPSTADLDLTRFDHHAPKHRAKFRTYARLKHLIGIPVDPTQVVKYAAKYEAHDGMTDRELYDIAQKILSNLELVFTRDELVQEIARRAGLKFGSCNQLLYQEKVRVTDQVQVEAFINRRIAHRAHRHDVAVQNLRGVKVKRQTQRETAAQYKDVIWQPDALPSEPVCRGPQYEFLTSGEDIVLMEGGKGSGKTDLLIFHCIRPEKLTHPIWHGVIFRREYKRLVECIDRATYWFGKLPQLKAHWQGSESRFVFPAGGWLAFHNVEHLGDEQKYQGWQIVDLLFDQLEEFEEAQFDYLMLQNRAGDLSLRCAVRATANPLGRGHAWVKRRFITNKKPSTTYLIEQEMEGIVYGRSFRRIHTTVMDNPLLKHDTKYIAALATDPNPIRRKAMFKGDWDVVLGQFFDQFISEIHVMPYRELPPQWRRAAGFDYGNVKVMEFLACDHLGNVYVEHEFRLEPNLEKPNGYTAMEFAEKSAEFMLERGLGEHLLVIGDVNLWSNTGRDTGSTKTPAVIITTIWQDKFKAKSKRPPVLLPVSKKGTEEYRYRVACNEAVRSYLGYVITKEGEVERQPKLFFFDTCQSIIQTLPALQADPNDLMDLGEKQDDHDYDAMKMPFMQVFAPKATATKAATTAEEKWAAQTEAKKQQPNTIEVLAPRDWRTDW